MKFRYDKENEELVVSEASRIEYHQISIWLTRYAKGYKYHPAFKVGAWNGQHSYFRNGKINLGLWKEVIRGCKEIDAKFILENKEDFPINRDVTLDDVKNFCDDFFKTHKYKNTDGDLVDFKPYDHQIESAYKILKNRYCIAEVATSGGKSLIISIVIFYTLSKINSNAKFLLIVPSITLVTQFYDDLIKYFHGENHLIMMRDEKINFILGKIENFPIDIRIEEIMSDRPRKWSGNENPNIYIGTYQSLEKWPKSFFKQFHTVISDECHQAKAKTIIKILSNTFRSAYSRFGLSGTTPPEDSCEILTIQSVLGPKITEVSADELKRKGIITPMDIKAVILNHNDSDINNRLKIIRKSGDGKSALELEKAYIHKSEKRLEFIKKLVSKCPNNTLLLFHTIENGKKIFDKLSSEIKDKQFFYIDGEVSGKKREDIKKQMEITKKKVEYTILNFGDYEIEFKSDFKILLSNGIYKSVCDVSIGDDVNNNFIKSKITKITGKRKEIREEEESKVLVASYGTLSTGVSIKAIFNVIFADSFKSEQIIIQSIGRGLRLHLDKEKVNIFDLVDVFDNNDLNNILWRHYKEREEFYKKRKYPFKIIKINL